MHPGRCARIEVGGRPVGHVGELHPRWRLAYELPQAPILFELELQALLDVAVPTFEPVPRQQAVQRDLALVLRDTVVHDALMTTLLADPAGLIRTATLFDIYKPASSAAGWQAGERSFAVRLELRDDAATLTDERIEMAVQAAIARASQAHGARLRA
jgi:phenylalanyl-tRNA synthetase beta chain